jgi:hypothetical protein
MFATQPQSLSVGIFYQPIALAMRLCMISKNDNSMLFPELHPPHRVGDEEQSIRAPNHLERQLPSHPTLDVLQLLMAI